MSSLGRSSRKGIAILGSTGSIGTQTLDVVQANHERFRVVALAAGSPSQTFTEQAQRYTPEIVSVSTLGDTPPDETARWLHGPAGLMAVATHPEVDIVVVATSGHAAIEPTMAAIKAGKTIALANKETLVCAGQLIMPLAAAANTVIRPIDSEHSAIWQAIGDAPPEAIDRIVLTASGGPFRTATPKALSTVTPAMALRHPTWSMGGKITIDSATLMNKGLEVIEAHWLFGLPYGRIDVLVHPESVIHSLVEFVDGSQLAQLGQPDMRVPIQYALSYPERWPRPDTRLDLAGIGILHFEQPDLARFPALQIARWAGTAGNTYPTVLSAADDVAVAAFLAGRLRFLDIPAIVQRALDDHAPDGPLSLESIFAADRRARETAERLIRKHE